MRVLWTINLGTIFLPADRPDIPGMTSAGKLDDDTFLGLGFMNPYNDLAVLNPSAWGQNLSPFIKLGTEALTGQTFTSDGLVPLSRPAGTGNINAYGKELPRALVSDLPALGYRTLGMTRPTAAVRDLVLDDVARYDTGDEVRVAAAPGGRRMTVPTERWGGDLGLLGRTVGIPTPMTRDVTEIRRMRDERLKALEQRRAAYNR